MKKLLYSFILLVLVSCNMSTNNSGSDSGSISISLSEDGQTVSVDCDTLKKYMYFLSTDIQPLDSDSISGKVELSLYKLLKSQKEINKIALLGTKNSGVFNIRFRIENKIDTTFCYTLPEIEIKNDNIQFSGFGAPLVRKEGHNSDKDLKIWLYRNKEHLNESQFELFKKLHYSLTSSNKNVYVPNGSIPVVHNIEGNYYKINADIQADYYAVVACKNQEFINVFIEQCIGNDFKGVSTSLSNPLLCHYKKGSSGYRNVFLLCINKDWSYKLIPLAMFALDNEAPSLAAYEDEYGRVRRRRSLLNPYYNYSYNEDKNDLPPMKYKDNIIILKPKNAPDVYGNASVCVSNWDGNGVECNVTFDVNFSGDVKSITILRTKKLCYPYFHSSTSKTIYAKDYNGSYTFNFMMHFEDGDNFIPVIVEDYMGNKVSDNIKLRARFVRNNTPSINIENNNTIYNDN